MPKIDQLFNYPVAGMQGFPVEELRINEKGIEGNRVFVVVTENEIQEHIDHPDYSPLRLTQTGVAELTLFQTEIEEGKLVLNHSGNRFNTELPTDVPSPQWPFANDYPAKLPLDKFLQQSAIPLKVAKKSTSQRWAIDCGETVAEWLTEKLNYKVKDEVQKVRLLRAIEKPGSKKEHFTWYTGLHALSQASLNNLAEEVGVEKIDIRTMRPNAIFSEDEGESLTPYEEIIWQTIIMGGIQASIDLCERCAYVAIDPETADRRTNAQVLVTINQRHDKNFGIYINPIESMTVRVGDHITVSTREAV